MLHIRFKLSVKTSSLVLFVDEVFFSLPPKYYEIHWSYLHNVQASSSRKFKVLCDWRERNGKNVSWVPLKEHPTKCARCRFKCTVHFSDPKSIKENLSFSTFCILYPHFFCFSLGVDKVHTFSFFLFKNIIKEVRVRFSTRFLLFLMGSNVWINGKQFHEITSLTNVAGKADKLANACESVL